MKITRKNIITGELITKDLPVTLEQLKAWHDGVIIQKAMPHLSADDREFILTGLSGEQWDEIFVDSKIVRWISSNFNHYMLVGSRYMKQKDSNLFALTKDTDYDFIVPNTDANKKFLKIKSDVYVDNIHNSRDYYFDNTTVAIAKFIGKFDAEVQISVRNDYGKVVSVWKNMDPEFYYNFIWKRGPVLANNDYKYLSKIVMNQLYKMRDN